MKDDTYYSPRLRDPCESRVEQHNRKIKLRPLPDVKLLPPRPELLPLTRALEIPHWSSQQTLWEYLDTLRSKLKHTWLKRKRLVEALAATFRSVANGMRLSRECCRFALAQYIHQPNRALTVHLPMLAFSDPHPSPRNKASWSTTQLISPL